MGGGGGGGDHGHGHGNGGDFRNKVWSMPGGPYCRPKHWRRNTAIAMFGVFLDCIPIAIKSAQLEQRPHHPVHPIPSQLWCKNFGTRTLELRTISDPGSSIASLVWIFTTCYAKFLCSLKRI